MLKNFPTYTSFSAKDLKRVKKFYTQKLGLKLEKDGSPNFLMFTAKGTKFMIYVKENHKPAIYTVLNFNVKKIENVVDELTKKGIKMEQYKELDTDEKGIAEFGDVKMAWFTDPEGNIIGLAQGM